MKIYQFPPIKAERSIRKAEEGLRNLAIERAEQDFKSGIYANTYPEDSPGHLTYQVRMDLLRGE